MKCIKCQGEMEEGIIADFIGNNPVPSDPKWGTSIKKGFMSRSLENPKSVVTNHCKNCGYLESYAK